MNVTLGLIFVASIRKEWPMTGIVKLTQKISRLCSKERTIEGFGLSRAPVFSLFPPLSFPQGEGI
jgi:hypothetical protein